MLIVLAVVKPNQEYISAPPILKFTKFLESERFTGGGGGGGEKGAVFLKASSLMYCIRIGFEIITSQSE
jgi:hypothetical protein